MSNTTTLARGFKLTRRDGQVMAFTDCDVDLVVGGVTYQAAAALTPSEAVSTLGLAVDDQDVQGALSSSVISERDLAAGVYDGAAVEVVEIDWSTQTLAAVVGNYSLGEVSRTEAAFTAELRSEAGVLAQKRGRYIVGPCDAELGDARCGVNTAPLAGAGSISTITGAAEFLVSGLESFTDTAFASGTLVWTSGANLGQACEISFHNGATLALWRDPLFPAQIGDAFDILPGCDKSFETCLNRYANGDNFRGCPTVVGEASLSYVVPGENNLDGGSFYDFT